ncbi:ROK family transcriptional regulator [Alloscardovia theropitheci]|uniref:ROK family transcriptional regulator n=1 Tax=Alloscardovia theropitheci TaxID=2496842 RepID=A0A4R0QS64_9BIFI|nr:ROK family transcriptional regulator [Alloscardovia theropitheci]TCD53945.1 ROK family transcriptional regulator [Alloscardovia theropitheci]
MPRQKALNQENLRAHNIGVVLAAILRSSQPVSRADISRMTGMTKAAISIIVADLIDREIIREGSPLQLASTGKPSNPLEFVDGKWLGLGVQIHTDGYGFIIQDFNGHVVANQWISDDNDLSNPRRVFDKLDELISPIVHKISKKNHVIGGGLAIPGMVTRDGLLVNAPNLGWSNVNLVEEPFVQKFSLTPLNEANLAAIAQIPGYARVIHDDISSENQLTAGASFIYISTDVGIGGAYIDTGNIVYGDYGTAGEIGHVSVEMNGPLCRCGRRGCMELYAGRHAVLTNAGAPDARKFSASDSYQYITENLSSPKTREALKQATRAMASAIVSTINIVDITHVIIGGFWTHFGQAWLDELRQEISSQLNSVHKQSIIIEFPTIDDHAAVHGAAEFGLRHLIDDVDKFLYESA